MSSDFEKNLRFVLTGCTWKASQQVSDIMMEVRGPEDDEEKRVFMVSSFSDQQMRLMEEAIARLGGRMTKEPILATHLITSSVAQNEKVLISAASGLWILHPSFVTESLSRGKWEEEENFEWGNQENGFLKFEEELSEEGGEENTEVKLAAAARKWRRESSVWAGEKVFSDIKAILLMPEQKKIQFEKLITAGGGQVIQAKAAIHLLHFDEDGDDTNAPEVTHIFTESTQTLTEGVDLPREVKTSRRTPRVSYVEVPDTNARKEKVNFFGLARRGIPVLNHLFLYDLLTSTSPPLTKHMLDEAKPHWLAYLTLAEEFLDSCFNGNLEGVRSALQSGVNVNTRDTWDSARGRSPGIHHIYPAFVTGKTGLMWAMLRKHNSVVELLLRTPGIDINATNHKEDQTALHMAMPVYTFNEDKFFNRVNYFYEEDFNEEDFNEEDFNEEDFNEEVFNENNNNPEGLALLLAREDLEVNHEDNHDWCTPLWYAVKGRAVECVKLLLADPRVDPDIRAIATYSGPNELALTPLMYAVKLGSEPEVLVPLFLANPRLSLNMKDHHDFGSTPLMRAVKENQREVVEMLLADARSDLDTRDTYERRDEDLTR